MTEQQAIEVLKDFDKQVSVKADGAYQCAIQEMKSNMRVEKYRED